MRIFCPASLLVLIALWHVCTARRLEIDIKYPTEGTRPATTTLPNTTPQGPSTLVVLPGTKTTTPPVTTAATVSTAATTTTAAPVTTAAASVTLPAPEVPTSGVLPDSTRDQLRNRLKAAGGCNANVCFAIDGSGRMPAAAFRAQKNFVLDLVSVIAVDEPVELSGVQYASRRYPISFLGVDIEKFVLRVNGTMQRGGYSRTRGGVRFCMRQLRTRPGEANKMVLLGDGHTSIGRSALNAAKLFRYDGGELSVVAAGDSDADKLLELAGGDAERVFDVTSFLDVLAIQDVIKKLVVDICEVGGRKGFPNRGLKRKQLLSRRRNREKRRERWANYCKKFACGWEKRPLW